MVLAPDRSKRIIAVIATLITISGLSIRPIAGGISAVLESFDYSVVMILLTPALYLLYSFNLSPDNEIIHNSREKLCVCVPSILLSLFMVLGSSFETANGFGPIVGSASQFAGCLIKTGAYCILFYNVIQALFRLLLKLDIHEEFKIEGNNASLRLLKSFDSFFKRRTFACVFLILLIIHLPYAVLSYPAIFWGDTPSQIAQGFNVSEETSEYLILISEDVRLNCHHPVFHTLMIHAFLCVGRLLNSYNLGIFLFAVFQLLTYFSVVALVIRYLNKLGVARIWLYILLAYYGFAPRMQNHSMLITKDIWYGIFTLLFIVSLDQIIRDYSSGIELFNSRYAGKYLYLFLSGFGMILFRNEGIYVVCATLLIAGIVRAGSRRILCLCCGGLIIITTMINHVIFPAFDISGGSRREMLSIPFQQTARYLSVYPEDVSQEEMESINSVLDGNHIAELYMYTRSDPVKATFNEAASSADMKRYFKTWTAMGLRHPGVYLGATINQIYQYFYPETEYMSRVPYADSTILMNHTNELMRRGGIQTDFHYPSVFNRLRNLYEQIGEAAARFPVLSVLSKAAYYLWYLLIILFYNLFKKERRGVILVTPLLLQILVCFAGPLGGTCFRYLYPVALSAFPAALMGILNEKDAI